MKRRQFLTLALVWLVADIEQAFSAQSQNKKRSVNQLINIDMNNFTLTFYENGRVIMRLPISGGGEYPYTWRDKRGRRHRAIAHTPRGTFRVYNKIPGNHRSSKGLGRMYYPVYFIGGIAIHGGRVPRRRHVSHGCIRIPMRSARRFYYRVKHGATVRVHG